MIWALLLLMSLLSSTLQRLLILITAALYPAYASCKAVHSRNPREYVHWMMYWVVLAVVLTIEPVVDAIFDTCVPFYAQLKMGVIFWLQSPSKKGASIVFRKAILPRFVRCEAEIDAYLSALKAEAARVGLTTAKYLTRVVLRSVLSHLRQNYSIADLIPSDLKFHSGMSESSWSSGVIMAVPSHERGSPATMSSPLN